MRVAQSHTINAWPSSSVRKPPVVQLGSSDDSDSGDDDYEELYQEFGNTKAEDIYESVVSSKRSKE